MRIESTAQPAGNFFVHSENAFAYNNGLTIEVKVNRTSDSTTNRQRWSAFWGDTNGIIAASDGMSFANDAGAAASPFISDSASFPVCDTHGGIGTNIEYWVKLEVESGAVNDQIRGTIWTGNEEQQNLTQDCFMLNSVDESGNSKNLGLTAAAGNGGGSQTTFYDNYMANSFPLLNLTIGAQQAFVGVDVSITAPTNGATLFQSQNIELNWTGSSDFNATLDYTVFINDVIDTSATKLLASNGTAQNAFLNVSNAGVINFTILATDAVNFKVAESIFTVKFFEFIDITFVEPVFETTTEDFNLSIEYAPDTVDDINSGFIYDNVFRGATAKSQNATHFNFQFSDLTVPIIQSNLTAINFLFNTTIEFSNASNIPVNTTTETQDIIFAYSIQNMISSVLEIFQDDSLTVDTTIQTDSKRAITILILEFNGTNTTMVLTTNNTLSEIYDATRNAPAIGPQNKTFLFQSYLNVTFQGIERVVNNTPLTLTVFKPTIVACGAGALTFITFDLADEINQTNVTGNMTVNLDIFGSTGILSTKISQAFNGSNSYPICLAPKTLDFRTEGFIQYEAPGYSVRENYMVNVTLTNTSQTRVLRLLTEVFSNEVSILVRDQSDSPVTNITVEMLRFFPAEDIFKIVAMTRSNANGDGLLNLQLSTPFYKFILRDLSGRILNEIESSQYADDTTEITLRTVLGNIGQFFITNGFIDSSCQFIFATTTEQCTVDDRFPGGSVTSFRLVVKELSLLGDRTQCDISTTESTFTFDCPFDNSTVGNKTFTIRLTANLNDGSSIILFNDQLSFGQSVEYGLNGVFGSVILVAGLGLAAVFATGSASALVAGTTVGIVLSKWIGLLIITQNQLLGLIIAALVLMWRMKR